MKSADFHICMNRLGFRDEGEVKIKWKRKMDNEMEIRFKI